MSRPRAADVEVEVVARRLEGGVVLLELAGRDGRALPRWEPGAHIDVLQPSGLVRQYSLAGDPASDRWRIGVLREEAGRGGSAWMADAVAEGAVLRLAGPRNHFPFSPPRGAPVLFLAAGIGVTPLVPMALAAREKGVDYRFAYSGRSRERLALVDELARDHGDRLELHLSDEGSRVDLADRLAGLDPATVVYACGPTRFLDAVADAAEAAGVELHLEHFEASALTPPVWPEPFEVELALSGITVEVPPERSILEVVEEQGVLVLSSCTEGTCGTCETVVWEGDIDHRDSILTPQEKARGDLMFICVSRAACPRIVLEL